MSFLPPITFVTCTSKTDFSTDGGQRGTITSTMTFCAAVPAQATEQADDTLKKAGNAAFAYFACIGTGITQP